MHLIRWLPTAVINHKEEEKGFSNRVVHPVSRGVSYLCSRTPQLLHGLLHPDGPGVSSAGSTSLDPNGEPGLAGRLAER